MTTPAQHPAASGKALFILGMHRSGTSAMARVLNLLGVELGSNLMDAADDNARGFWEQEDIVQLHERLLAAIGSIWHSTAPLPENWHESEKLTPFRDELRTLIEQHYLSQSADIWALKDPRMSLLLPFWKPLLAENNIALHCIIALRHPREVAGSLARRDGFSPEHSIASWLHYTLMAERHSRGLPRAVMAYDSLLQDWKPAVTTLAERLAITWPVAPDDAADAIDAFLSPDLRHNTSGNSDPLPDDAARLYALMRQAEESGNIDNDALDTLYTQWQHHAQPHSGCLQHAILQYAPQQDALQAELADLTSQRDTLLTRYEEAEMRAQHAQNALQSERNTSTELQQQVEAFTHSTSWKLTKPLRAAKTLVKSDSKE